MVVTRNRMMVRKNPVNTTFFPLLAFQEYSFHSISSLCRMDFDKHFDKQFPKNMKKGLGATAEALLRYSVFSIFLNVFSYMPMADVAAMNALSRHNRKVFTFIPLVIVWAATRIARAII